MDFSNPRFKVQKTKDHYMQRQFKLEFLDSKIKKPLSIKYLNTSLLYGIELSWKLKIALLVFKSHTTVKPLNIFYECTIFTCRS